MRYPTAIPAGAQRSPRRDSLATVQLPMVGTGERIRAIIEGGVGHVAVLSG